MKRIICRNEDGVQVEFNYNFEPFFLVSVDGIYTVSNNVVTSENTMVDGSTYQGSTTKQRNIVITAQMESDYQKNRDLLYKCFKPKSTGLFTYMENEEVRVIDYKVEDIDIDEKGIVRNFTISLLCPDPFFRDLEDLSVSMASWTGLFEWPHEFLEEKEPFAERTAEVLKEIENDSSADNIGITVTLEAEGPVINPAVYHAESGEFIKIGTEERPFSVNAGDVVIITTETNNKAVYLVRDGVKTEVNEYLDEDSDFIQLQHGTNTIRYAADAGEDYMNVTISYRFRYLGV